MLRETTLQTRSVRKEGRSCSGGGEAAAPLQPMERPLVEPAVPLQPVGPTAEISTLQPMEEPPL